MLLLIAIFLPLSALCDNPTFNNVLAKGYIAYTLRFTKLISGEDNLKNQLPNSVYDHLEFSEQNVPILKRNAISDLEYLYQITIERCNVTNIEPGAFQNLPLLKTMSLKGNLLETIPTGVFNSLELLLILDLSTNRIKSIEEKALNNMPELEIVDLSNNLIEKWNPNWFFNDPLLTQIWMRNNSLQQIPSRAFVNFKGTKKFGSISLDFSFNKISNIESDAFYGLDHIDELSLNNNQLQKFGEDLLNNTTVRYLSLWENRIECIDGNLNKTFKAETINLDLNPFNCSCLERIQKWDSENGEKITTVHSGMNCSLAKLDEEIDKLNELLKNTEEIEVSESN